MKATLVTIKRYWHMPNKYTFLIQPISKLLKEEILPNEKWIDPYAGIFSPAHIKNDLNPKIKANYHLDALEFLKMFEDNSVDGILFDPPYSLRQLKECYNSIEITPKSEIFNTSYQAKQKDIISRIVKPGHKVICFGWNSNGIGKTRGFKLEKILMIAHGRQHNDTIVTVEKKINHSIMEILNKN